MRIGAHDTDVSVYIVAEIGNNHEGDIALAEELIGRAAEAGANAVKLQKIVPERLVSASDTARITQLHRICLGEDAFPRLAAVAEREGVTFLSTPFDIVSVAVLAPLVPAYKIASGDLTCAPLIAAIAATGKPIIASTGASTIEEIAAMVAGIHRVWDTGEARADLALLHCVASYPTPPAEANLAAIATLRQRFPNCTIGYSDHTMGNDAAVAAVALGARIIEKHFTIRHDYSEFRDHQLSATPDEFRALVDRIRMTEAMLGSGEKIPQPCEVAGRMNFRRSVAAAWDLPAGTVLRRDDLTWVRPGDGIPPGKEGIVIGKQLVRDIAAGTLIAPEHLAQVSAPEWVRAHA